MATVAVAMAREEVPLAEDQAGVEVGIMTTHSTGVASAAMWDSCS